MHVLLFFIYIYFEILLLKFNENIIHQHLGVDYIIILTVACRLYSLNGDFLWYLLTNCVGGHLLVFHNYPSISICTFSGKLAIN